MSHGAAAKPRLLLVQPVLTDVGGGSGVAAWMLEALRHDFDVTLLTWQRPNLDDVNAVFGTGLTASDFACREGPAALRRGLALAPTPLALFKDSLLLRHARDLAPAYDLLICACGEHDLGGHGIQYVHYPRFARRPAGDLHAPYHHPLLVRAYRTLALRLTGTRLSRVPANRTLANSRWVADIYQNVHGGAVEVLNPPAAGPFPAVPWQARENGIVCIGRLSPEKRVEYVIEIVERVRALGHDLHLHVVGMEDFPAYGDQVRRLATPLDWVTFHGRLSRTALSELVARQRYGIHGMAAEHFGMAVAEMIAGGCIAFVPDDGGQREIVNGDPRLQFGSAVEGAEKIARVMADAALQQELRASLAARRADFTPERFMQRIRAVVAEALAAR